MVKGLEIPGYETLVKNSTYGREAEPIEHPESKRLYPATQIMQLVKYNTPSESEVIKLIQTASKEFDSFLNKEHRGTEDMKYILRTLKRFSNEEIKKIAQEEKGATEHLKLHYSQEGSEQPRRTYIRCVNGTIPNEVLDSAERQTKKHKDVMYEELISGLKISRWLFKVRLDGKGNFPSKGELEPLLEKEVRDCCIFKTDVRLRDYQDAAEQVKLLAEVFSLQENIEKIEDFSERVLTLSARYTLDHTLDCIMKKEIAEGITRGLMGRGLGGIIGGFIDLSDREGEEDEEKDDFSKDW